MDEKDLLQSWEEINSLYGKQNKTFDEFRNLMQSDEYREKVFRNLGDNAKSVFGYDNYIEFNADKFQGAPVANPKDAPVRADNLAQFGVDDTRFFNQQRRSGRGEQRQKELDRREQRRLDIQADKDFAASQRARRGSANMSEYIAKGYDFNTIVDQYSRDSDEDAKLAGQLNYNSGKLEGVEKGQFEQKAINNISEDMFSILDASEKAGVFKENKDEYLFLYQQINATNKEINQLQNELVAAGTKEEKEAISEEIQDLLEQGSEITFQKNDTDTAQFVYGSYKDMTQRLAQLNQIPEFKNYNRAITNLNYLKDISENFDKRNPEFVKMLEEQREVQLAADVMDKADIGFGIPSLPGYVSNDMADGVVKPILKSLSKLVVDVASLPRTLSFNDEYGWTDALAEGAERLMDPKNSLATTISSRKDRGLYETITEVDGYQVTIDDANPALATSVRDKEGFVIQDEEVVADVIKKYEANPDAYEKSEKFNSESLLPKFTGVVSDLAIQMIGTKGIGSAVRATGGLAKTTKVGNYLTKSTVSNRLGLTGTVVGQTHNELYNEGIRNGLSGSEASLFATSGSLAVATVAQINPQFYLIGDKKVASDLTKRYINYLARNGETRKTALRYAFQEVFKQGGREALEEAVEIPALNAVRFGMNQITTPDKDFEIKWSMNELKEATTLGFLAGFGSGPVNVTSSSRLHQESLISAYRAKDKFFNSVKNFEGKRYIDPETGNEAKFSKEQAESVTDKYKSLFNELDAMKIGSTLEGETELEALVLLDRANTLKDLSDNTKNPKVQEDILFKYSQVQDRLGEIQSENKTEINPKETKQPEVKTEEQKMEEFTPTEGVQKDTESKMSPILESIMGIKPEPTPDPEVKSEGDQNTESEPSPETKVDPKPLFTPEEISTAKANDDYLTPLIERLKSNFPGINVEVDAEAIAELAKSQDLNEKSQVSAKGVFDPANNRVVINPNTATKDTPIHEFGHVWTGIAKTERPDLLNKGFELIKGSKIEQELRERIKNDPEQAKVYTEDKILEEALAIAIGRRGAKLYEDQQKQNAWDNWIKDFFNFIKGKFNVNSEGDIADLTLREFVELASFEILTGEKVVGAPKPDTDMKTDDKGQGLLFQANYNDPETGFEFSYDKNGDRFKRLEVAEYITRDKGLGYFNGKPMILHSPDFAFSGSISKDGEIIVEGKGGMYYPIRFHDKGYFWASTKDAANGLVKLLNRSLEQSPDGKVRMGLVTAPREKALSSTTASNAVVDIFTSKAFLDAVGVSDALVKSSLVRAANKTTVKISEDFNEKTGKTSYKEKKVGLDLKLSVKMDLDEVLSEIRTKLGADNSSFSDRKFFVQEVFRRISDRLVPKKDKNKPITISPKTLERNKEKSRKIHAFFKRQFPEMKGQGNNPVASMSNLTEAFSYMIGEPIIRSETETGNVYAVLEAEGEVKAVESDQHESYPFAVQMANPNSKVTLNILKDRINWKEGFDTDIKNNEGKQKTDKQIFPTTTGVTVQPLTVTQESPQFQVDEGTNKKQIFDVLQSAKEKGVGKSEAIFFLNNRFPDISKAEMSEMWEGKQPEEAERTANRKYTTRLGQILSGETTEKLSEEAKTYIPKRNNVTSAEADLLLEQLGLEQAADIVKNNPKELLPEVRIALANKVIPAVEQKIQNLRSEGKQDEADLLSGSLNSLIESVTEEGTRAGRMIQAFRLLEALAPDRLVSQVNKRLKKAGRDELTEEEVSRLKELKKKVDESEEGLPKSEALAEQFKFIAAKIGTTKTDLFEAYFYASILSGITTQERNILANVMSIMGELTVTSIREAFRGNPGAIFKATEGMIKGLSKGWLNAKYILETGVKSARADKFDNPTLLEWYRINTNNSVINKIANSKFLPWSPNFLKYVQRAMVAGDQMFYHAAKDMQAFALASRIKKGKDVTPEDYRKANEILNPPKEFVAESELQAKEEGLEPGTTRYKVRVAELIEGKRDMTIQGTAEDFGTRTTFNYQPEGALSYVYDAVVNLRNQKGVGTVVTTFIPFARVLTNVFNRFLHWTPVGYASGAIGTTKISGGKSRKLSQDERADMYIKATIGTSTLLGLVSYLLSGDKDDDDKYLKISAAGPTDLRKKYELQKAGWKPYTITIGDVSFSYVDSPLYFILASAGTLYESDKYGNEIDSNLFTYVATTTAMSMLGQSWLQGLSDLGKILNSPNPSKAVVTKAFNVIGAIAIPNFYKQKIRLLKEVLDDPIKARREGTLDYGLDGLYRDIPGLNSGLYDMVDVYGDPIIPKQGQKFMPLDLSFSKKGEPLAKILTDHGAFIGYAGRRNVYNEEDGDYIQMSDDQYAVYKIAAAKKTGELLRANFEAFKSLEGDNYAIQKLVKEIKTNAREIAYNELFYGGGYERLRKK